MTEKSSHLKRIRETEIESVLKFMPEKGNILEVGGGAGWMALHLKKAGFKVISIDIEKSGYEDQYCFPILIYDGINFPFPDRYFDFIFT